MLARLAVLILLMTVGSALAQTPPAQASAPAPAPAAPPPACDVAPYDAFDFWVGEWEVTTPGGQMAGTNRITKEENGCLIVERWTGAQGSTGQSYNFYDPGTKVWRQVWVARGATIDYQGGLDEAGAMRLEGEIAYRNGNRAPFRGVWTPMEDGRVEQVFTQYDAASESWQPWFTGLYTRQSPEASAK